MIVSYSYKLGENKYLVSLTSGDDSFFATNNIVAEIGCSVEIAEVCLDRLSGVDVTNVQSLMKIADIIASFMLSNENVVLYYYCEDVAPVVSKSRSKSTMPPQEYRSRLFSLLFQRYVKTHNITNIIDTPVYVDAVGWPIYMHVISRKEHLDQVKRIEDFISANYGK